MPAIHPQPAQPVLYVNDNQVDPGDGEDVGTVGLEIGSEVSSRCGACCEELTDTVAGFTSDDGGPSCPDYQPGDHTEGASSAGAHVPVAVPLSWCNSAGISLDAAYDSVTVSVSVDDPRGAFVFTVRRIPDDVDGPLAGRLILNVPDPTDTAPHTRLTAIRPGTFLVGEPIHQVARPGRHAA